MAEYLGTLGRMVQLRCASTERLSRPDRYILQGDATGGVRAQLRPRTPRAWDIDVAALNDRDLAALEGFVEGEWGAGPWQWVSIAAQHGNLLTPAESLCLHVPGTSGVPAGPMMCADGTWSGRSVDTTYRGVGWVMLWHRIPVLPGRAVTFSADVSGDGETAPRVALGFYDVAGVAVSGPHLSSPGRAVGVSRVSVSHVPAAGAAEARVGVLGSVYRLARPQVTWATTESPWAVGKGCRKAVPLGVDSSLLWSPGPGKGLSGVHVTIQEIS